MSRNKPGRITFAQMRGLVVDVLRARGHRLRGGSETPANFEIQTALLAEGIRIDGFGRHLMREAMVALGIPMQPKPAAKAERKPRMSPRPPQKAPRPATPVSPVSPATPDFLMTYEWRRVRMIALKRDGAKCRCCGATPADGVRMNVDHIKPRRIFPQLALDPNNLQVLCEDCNHGKGNWDMTDWRESALLRADT